MKKFIPVLDQIGRQPVTVSLPTGVYVELKAFCKKHDIKMSGCVCQMVKHCLKYMGDPK